VSTIEMCPMCGRGLGYEVNGKTYSKATLVEIRGVYDGGLFYADVEGCGKAWHRWSDISAYTRAMRDKAQPYLDQWNEAHADV
jgi:hypothetical protein